MNYRVAVAGDEPAIMLAIEDAKAYLKSCGVDQWQDGFPVFQDIKEDVASGNGYVFCINDEVMAFVLFGDKPEKAYEGIYDGKWLTSGTPYGVIHRTAVRAVARGMGISRDMFELCERLSRERGFKSVRLDTHEDNATMRHIAEKNGYKYCGKMFLERDMLPRIGYEKLL
jgi:GNAT superfamily N-acetyltransferase